MFLSLILSIFVASANASTLLQLEHLSNPENAIQKVNLDNYVKTKNINVLRSDIDRTQIVDEDFYTEETSQTEYFVAGQKVLIVPESLNDTLEAFFPFRHPLIPPMDHFNAQEEIKSIQNAPIGTHYINKVEIINKKKKFNITFVMNCNSYFHQKKISKTEVIYQTQSKNCTKESNGEIYIRTAVSTKVFHKISSDLTQVEIKNYNFSNRRSIQLVFGPYTPKFSTLFKETKKTKDAALKFIIKERLN